LAAIRLFDPCEDKTCDVIEDQSVRRLASLRWYQSSVSHCHDHRHCRGSKSSFELQARIDDGSILIMGGSWDNMYVAAEHFVFSHAHAQLALSIINLPNITNPTYEYYPPKNMHGTCFA